MPTTCHPPKWPAFRRATPDDWEPTIPTLPPRLDPAGEGWWVTLALGFNNRTTPEGWDGDTLRFGCAQPWQRKVAVLRHQGCGGVVGTVLNTSGLTVLGVLDRDRLYRHFEALRISVAPYNAAGLSAATDLIDTGTCRRCHQTIPIHLSRRHLRSLPHIPNKKPQTITV